MNIKIRVFFLPQNLFVLRKKKSVTSNYISTIISLESCTHYNACVDKKNLKRYERINFLLFLR